MVYKEMDVHLDSKLAESLVDRDGDRLVIKYRHFVQDQLSRVTTLQTSKAYPRATILFGSKFGVFPKRNQDSPHQTKSWCHLTKSDVASLKLQKTSCKLCNGSKKGQQIPTTCKYLYFKSFQSGFATKYREVRSIKQRDSIMQHNQSCSMSLLRMIYSKYSIKTPPNCNYNILIKTGREATKSSSKRELFHNIQLGEDDKALNKQ